MEIATLGGGCFWCLDAVYRGMKGVSESLCGYAGGHVDNPSYEAVCGKKTGHAEVVRLRFDPQVISYADILRVFFTIHDPTTRNRQGNDVGPQYRSAIFCHGDGQQREAEAFITELTVKQVFQAPIVTEVTPAVRFWIAEDYHQEYFAQHGHEPYCQYVVAPKVAKFRKVFANRRKTA